MKDTQMTITTDDIIELGGHDLMRAVGCVYPDIQPPHWGDDDEDDDVPYPYETREEYLLAGGDKVSVTTLRDIRDEISCLIDAAVEEYAQSGQMRRYDACQLLEFLGGALRNGH